MVILQAREELVEALQHVCAKPTSMGAGAARLSHDPLWIREVVRGTLASSTGLFTRAYLISKRYTNKI
jgi:hypothetical protein